MTDILVNQTFRHAGGALASFEDIHVRARGSLVDIVVEETDRYGLVSLYLPPGTYDWYALGYTVPFDVVAPEEFEGDVTEIVDIVLGELEPPVPLSNLYANAKAG